MSSSARDSQLLIVGSDGAHRASQPGPEDMGDPVLTSLLALRSMLGSAPEDQIGTRLPLPSAFGTAGWDQVLPATLVLLAGASGDMTASGWRLGPGADHAWRRAQEMSERVLDAARIAWHGADGTIELTAIGPATLSAAAQLHSGERLLADVGAMRDLPLMLAEGLRSRLEQVREQHPEASLHVLLREEHVDAVHRGAVRTASGRGRYPVHSAAQLSERWAALLGAIGDQHDDVTVTLECGRSADLLRAARDAGATALALTPAALPTLTTAAGRETWEAIARAADDGIGLEILIDPGDQALQDVDRFLQTVRELGLEPAELAPLGVLARANARHAHRRDPARDPRGTDLLPLAGIESLLRLAPGIADRLSD